MLVPCGFPEDGRDTARLHVVPPKSDVKIEETSDKQGWSKNGWISGTKAQKSSEEYPEQFVVALAAAVVAGLGYAHVRVG